MRQKLIDTFFFLFLYTYNDISIKISYLYEDKKTVNCVQICYGKKKIGLIMDWYLNKLDSSNL